MKTETAEDILLHYETYVRLADTPIFLKENVLKAMQAYADQQVNRVLDDAIKAVDGIVSRGGEVEALLDVYEILESLKIKQP